MMGFAALYPSYVPHRIRETVNSPQSSRIGDCLRPRPPLDADRALC